MDKFKAIKEALGTSAKYAGKTGTSLRRAGGKNGKFAGSYHRYGPLDKAMDAEKSGNSKPMEYLAKKHAERKAELSSTDRGSKSSGAIANKKGKERGLDSKTISKNIDPKRKKINRLPESAAPESKNNLVAKHMNKYNKPSTQKDQKKALKRGEIKHKQKMYENADLLALVATYNEARMTGNVQLASEKLEELENITCTEAKRDLDKLGFHSLKKDYLKK